MTTTLIMILLAGSTMLLLALVMGYVLGWANRAFHVEVDPRIEAANEALPGANCGGCGYVGCMEYAEAVVTKGEAVDKCPVGGPSVAEALADILGVEVAQSWPHRPVVHCRATLSDRKGRSDYVGEQTCAAANVIAGLQGCVYGCMGLGDCVRSCKFDAIHVVDGLAQVDYDKCTGCGACQRVCPRNIITMIPFKTDRMLVVQCSNQDFGKEVKEVCEVGCIGCGACHRASELFNMDGSLAKIDYEKYNPAAFEELNVPQALAKCPMKGLVFVGAPSERDKQAVADEKSPEVSLPEFETTADQADWRG